MPCLHHSVARALRRDRQTIELSRQANREIAYVDHLLNLAEAFGRDLSRFERDEPRQFRLGGAQFLGKQADEGASARRRNFSPDAKRVFRIGDGGGRRLGIAELRPPDRFASDRRARLGLSMLEGLGRNAQPPKYLRGLSINFARQCAPPSARPAHPLCSESRAGRAELITYLIWSRTGARKVRESLDD